VEVGDEAWSGDAAGKAAAAGTGDAGGMVFRVRRGLGLGLTEGRRRTMRLLWALPERTPRRLFLMFELMNSPKTLRVNI
jgi:hypothetical protein